MNQKIKEYSEELRKIKEKKSVYVTKKRHFDLLIIAFIFVVIGLLIGYIANLLTNLSYVTNTVVVTVLGSIILYRYSTEMRFRDENHLKYNIHLAVLPRLIRDITNIIGTVLVIVLVCLYDQVSIITVIFYVSVFLILIITNFIIAPIQESDDANLSLIYLIMYALYNLVIFYLFIKLLPVDTPGVGVLIVGLVQFIFVFLTTLGFKEKAISFKLKAVAITCIIITIIYGLVVYTFIPQLSEQHRIKAVFNYDYEYYSLYEGGIFDIESSGSRIMMVTHDFDLIVYDQDYNQINRFDVSDLGATFFDLYEVANQFYLSISKDTVYINYDTYYMIDEVDGLTLIDTNGWTKNSFIYDSHTILINYWWQNKMIGDLGTTVSLYDFMKKNPYFMIEDNDILYFNQSEYYYDSFIFTNNEGDTYSRFFYDEGLLFYADYNSDTQNYDMYITEVYDFIDNFYTNGMYINAEETEISPATLNSFQYINNTYYFVNRYTSDYNYVFKITALDEEGKLIYTHMLYDSEFSVYSNYFVKETDNEVLITTIDSEINTYVNTLTGTYRIQAICMLLSMLIFGYIAMSTSGESNIEKVKK